MAGRRSFSLHCDFRAPMIGPPAADLYAEALVEGVDDVIVDPIFRGVPLVLAEESLELITSRVPPAFRSGSAPDHFALNRKDDHAPRTQ